MHPWSYPSLKLSIPETIHPWSYPSLKLSIPERSYPFLKLSIPEAFHPWSYPSLRGAIHPWNYPSLKLSIPQGSYPSLKLSIPEAIRPWSYPLVLVRYIHISISYRYGGLEPRNRYFSSYWLLTSLTFRSIKFLSWHQCWSFPSRMLFPLSVDSSTS